MTDTGDRLEENPFKQVIEDLFQNRMYASFKSGAVLPMIREIMTFSQEIIDSIEKDGQIPQAACRSGCDYCCYSRLAVLPAEALLILSFINDNFDRIERKNLKEDIRRTDRITRGKSMEERFELKEKTPCIFLKGGICRIYPVRPFICRAWSSVDEADCRTAFYSGSLQSEIETIPARDLVFGSARAMVLGISRQLSLQSGRLELFQAMSRCLEVPDPLSHWLAGDRIFDFASDLKPVDLELSLFKPPHDPDPPKPDTPQGNESDYVHYFYTKYKGRVSLGVGYDQNFTEIYPFIFQDVCGDPVGLVAMAVSDYGSKSVHIYHLGAFITRNGDGSMILGELCRKADCFDIQLTVSPVFMPNGRDPHMDYTQLSHWYERFNFKGEANLTRLPRKKTIENSV